MIGELMAIDGVKLVPQVSSAPKAICQKHTSRLVFGEKVHLICIMTVKDSSAVGAVRL